MVDQPAGDSTFEQIQQIRADIKGFTEQAHALGREFYGRIEAAYRQSSEQKLVPFDDLQLWLRDAWGQLGAYHLQEINKAQEQAYGSGIEKGKAMGFASGAMSVSETEAETKLPQDVIQMAELKPMMDRAKKIRVTQGPTGTTYEIEV